jgi:hypothetical protein
VLGKTLTNELTSPASYFRALGEWLTQPAGSPFYPPQYLLEHLWRALASVKFEEPIFSYFEKLLSQCANFIEPKGLPGDDTPQRRFAAKLRGFLEEREIPPCLLDVWEVVKSREGRGRWFEILQHSLSYRSKDDSYGKHIETAGLDYEMGFVTLTVHDERTHPEFFEKVTSVYKQLGFSNTRFDPGKIETVEMGLHLRPKIKERLGYGVTDKVPGYRYRLQTTPDYLDSNKGRIDIDLIMPIVKTTSENKDTPVFFVLPRPAAPYRIFESITYELNVRLMRRVFKAETGYDLLRYVFIFKETPTEVQKHDPFYHATYQPFVNNRTAFENKPEYDFSKWQGEPLPPLFP